MKVFKVVSKTSRGIIEYSPIHLTKREAFEQKKILKMNDGWKELVVIEVEFNIVSDES